MNSSKLLEDCRMQIEKTKELIRKNRDQLDKNQLFDDGLYHQMVTDLDDVLKARLDDLRNKEAILSK